jgi:hypothetical protein
LVWALIIDAVLCAVLLAPLVTRTPSRGDPALRLASVAMVLGVTAWALRRVVVGVGLDGDRVVLKTGLGSRRIGCESIREVVCVRRADGRMHLRLVVTGSPLDLAISERLLGAGPGEIVSLLRSSLGDRVRTV